MTVLTGHFDGDSLAAQWADARSRPAIDSMTPVSAAPPRTASSAQNRQR
jgi:hypothetical protein